MAHREGIGIAGLALAVAMAIAMCIISYIKHPVDIVPVEYGICLPSPDCWHFPPFLSWIINTILIGLVTFLLYLVNRTYNFIRTTEPALMATFMIMTASNPWFTQGLNTSVLLCLVNTVCLGLIFGAYEMRNATSVVFIPGLALGIGSMFQYAFLPMTCVYALWLLLMRVLRLREFLAFVVGFLSPYWIALGFGWLHLSQFHFPSLVAVFSVSSHHSDILFLLLGIGIAALIGFLVGLPNSIKLYAGNSRINSMNMCVSILGIASFVCILIDYENMPAYVMSLYLAAAVQLANICALWNPRHEWTVTVIPSLVFILLFIGNLFL